MADYVVEHNSPVAAWGQVSRDLRRQIEDGGLAPGTRLLTERELAETYGVSRITVRQALEHLSRDGLIVRRHGSGTFVSDRVSTVQHDLGITGSWRAQATADGKRASSEEIEVDVDCAAPVALLGELGWSAEMPEAGWVYLKRVHLVEESPIGITQSWVAPGVAPGIANEPLVNDSLGQTLITRFGIHPAVTRNIMQVGSASSAESRLLHTYLDAPLYIVKSATETSTGELAEISKTSWLGNRVKFRYDREHEPRLPKRADAAGKRDGDAR